MSISITAINFHDGKNNTTYNFGGSHGYTLPAGHVSAAIDFKIELTDDDFIVMTEVISGQTVSSYDELVRIAYRRVANRLVLLGEMGKKLKTSIEADKPGA